CGSYSVKRMALPHAAHKRPLPRQIQIFAGASRGSTPALTFFRTRSASDFGTGSSRRRMNLAPDDTRRNVIRRYTRSPHGDRIPVGVEQGVEWGYEGYVAKDEASPYEGGPTMRWLKVKQKDRTVGGDQWTRRISVDR